MSCCCECEREDLHVIFSASNECVNIFIIIQKKIMVMLYKNELSLKYDNL